MCCKYCEVIHNEYDGILYFDNDLINETEHTYGGAVFNKLYITKNKNNEKYYLTLNNIKGCCVDKFDINIEVEIEFCPKCGRKLN